MEGCLFGVFFQGGGVVFFAFYYICMFKKKFICLISRNELMRMLRKRRADTFCFNDKFSKKNIHIIF